jgi:glycosyltransferase involved in cell wall biosynthesis
MKILEIETFGRGGLAHYAYNLSQALAGRGHEVTFLTAAAYELDGYDRGLSHVEVRKPIGRVTHRFAAATGVFKRFLTRVEAVWDAVAVVFLAARLRPDVIHFHCTNPVALVYLILFRLLGTPVAYTAHVVTPHEPILFQTRLYGLLHRLPNLIVAHSEFDRRRLLDEYALSTDRVTVIPHGEYGFFQTPGDVPDRAAARQGLGIDVDGEVVLFFGYIRDYKGLDLLLEAWPSVKKSRPNACLLIAGDPVRLDPARRDELEAWAARLGAHQRFEYIPFEDVSSYFVAADLLVLPYRRMSQSGVLFLALALGTPVVATMVGPLPEMLQDGETAVLVAPDAAPALAKGLVRGLSDPELRTRLSEGGRRMMVQYSWPSIAERTEQALVEIV